MDSRIIFISIIFLSQILSFASAGHNERETDKGKFILRKFIRMDNQFSNKLTIPMSNEIPTSSQEQNKEDDEDLGDTFCSLCNAIEDPNARRDCIAINCAE
ncbi:uncharacterized protein LOC134270317 [Saccostrea cucullata]|uniref:uncharacterized protein LOC134270317 n=1 Tax=Saccostrea cuccullata TaxID=36930 RepID=UPI002ED4AF15